MADANVNTVSMTERQKVKKITDKLEEGLKELFESEKYKSYLSTMSKFHNYSFNNTLLIAMQKPEASLVAGYQAWQKNFKVNYSFLYIDVYIALVSLRCVF